MPKQDRSKKRRASVKEGAHTARADAGKGLVWQYRIVAQEGGLSKGGGPDSPLPSTRFLNCYTTLPQKKCPCVGGTQGQKGKSGNVLLFHSLESNTIGDEWLNF